MSSTPVEPQSSAVSCEDVKRLRDDFLALRSDCFLLRQIFGDSPRMSGFVEPDWCDLDDVAFSLQDNLRIRGEANVPVKINQQSQYEDLQRAFRRTKKQLLALRDRLEGPEAYEYPIHAEFQILGPGNQTGFVGEFRSYAITMGLQKFPRYTNPERRGAETAATNKIMSRALPRDAESPGFEDDRQYFDLSSSLGEMHFR